MNQDNHQNCNSNNNFKSSNIRKGIKVRARAPANIALIKYMGKVTESLEGDQDLRSSINQSTNLSFSYTLDHLRTVVVIDSGGDGDQESNQEFNQGSHPETNHEFHREFHQDFWEPLLDPEFSYQVKLSPQGEKKFLNHFSFLKEKWNITGTYRLRSANNFPADCGLASSASSFAALTKATALLAEQLGVGGVGADSVKSTRELQSQELARLSRRGSGSSCRSFHEPWVLWDQDRIEPMTFSSPFHQLCHQVVVVEAGKKEVSSSEAHGRVRSSLLYADRMRRTQLRWQELKTAMEKGDWALGFEICWAEFWDMHALFATSRPGFSYLKPLSFEVLNWVREEWNKYGDGPWATMDAGANVHLLFRIDQKQSRERLKSQAQQWGTLIISG